MNLLSINNHTFLFIMFIWIQVSIIRFKDILIIICIWIKGTQGKNIILSQTWTIVVCIYPNTRINIDKKVNVKLKVFKHSWIGVGIGATPKNNALIGEKFDEKTKNANANGEYNDDHVRASTLNLKKMIKMRKKKGRENIDEKTKNKWFK